MINRLPESFLSEARPSRAANEQEAFNLDRETRRWMERLETVVREHPGAAIAAAFFVGATLAWWVKRR